MVTVIVPAYNAAATIADTLQSVAAQDHRDFELIIVDDGSSDNSADIARRFCEAEPRARLVAQANGGVARARNLGLAEARTRWVAPVDADDIWHPGHLSSLLALAHTSSPGTVMLFALSRHIDVRSNVLLSPDPRHTAGPALAWMATRNIVGNGSALLLDRVATLAVGGYDARLRDAGCEGCEDYLLQLRLAARYSIASTPLYTVGYRQLPEGMSKNVETMHASQRMARALLFAEEPATQLVPDWFWRWAKASSHLTLFRNRLRRRRLPGAAAALLHALWLDPAGSALTLASDARRVFARLIGFGRRRRPRYRHFMDVPPAEAGTAMFDPPVRTGLLAKLQRRRQAQAITISSSLQAHTAPVP